MTLPTIRVIPGWERKFLLSIKNGYNEKTAANAAGVGTAEINRQLAKNSGFKEDSYSELV